MLSVIRTHLPSTTPIAGCELSPYVLLRKSDGNLTAEEVTEANPIDGLYLRNRWYRIQTEKRTAVCSVHASENATLQCLGCVKAKVPLPKSYHCTTECFQAAWQNHRSLHARVANGGRENGAEEEEGGFGKLGAGAGAGGVISTLASALASGHGSSFTGVPNVLPPVQSRVPEGLPQANGETWYEVGRGRTYTPQAEDVGHVLKLECTVCEVATGVAVSPPFLLLTTRVIPAPSPTPRRVVNLTHADANGGGASRGGGGVQGPGAFTMLSYNVLAELYAASEQYSYCPAWAMSWAYRRQNLLRELVGYQADIMCLQEVQGDHFEEFFAPELDKLGYASVYKKKTGELFTGTTYTIDGCATFFRRERFSLVKKYEVEFNKAALALADTIVNPATKKSTLNRLLKDNVALIVVLEALDAPETSDLKGGTKRQLLCVANTHIHANPELKDVKLWQVHTLLKGLEKIAASANIPMIVAGDFNSVPGSAPHALLASGRVDPNHPELTTDPFGILRPFSKLCHSLPLVSAYTAFCRPGAPVPEADRRRMDPITSEPLFTNCTRDFVGTLDYIFYTADQLGVESLLELVDEEVVRRETALPTPSWSSDHMALLAEFRYKPRHGGGGGGQGQGQGQHLRR